MDISIERTRQLIAYLREAQIEYHRMQAESDVKVFMNFALVVAPPPREIIEGFRYILDAHSEKLNQYVKHDQSILPPEILISFTHAAFGITNMGGNALGPDNILLGQGAMTLTIEAVRQTVGYDGFLIVPYPTYGALVIAMDFLSTEQFILVPTTKSHNFMISPSQLDQAIAEANRRSGHSRSNKVFLSIDPHNPTMRVATTEAKQALLPILVKKRIHVIDDRVYDGTQHQMQSNLAYGAFPELADSSQVTTIYSLGKALGGANIKAGFAISAPEILLGMDSYMSNRFRYVDVTAQSAMARILAPSAKSSRTQYQQKIAMRDRFGQRLMRALIEGGITDDKFKELEQLDTTGFLSKVSEESNPLWQQMRELMGRGVDGVQFAVEPAAGHTQLLAVSDLYGKYCGNDKIDTSIKAARLFLSEGILTYPGDSFLYPDVVRANFSIDPENLVRGVLGLQRSIEKLKE